MVAVGDHAWDDGPLGAMYPSSMHLGQSLPQFRPAATPLADLLSLRYGGFVRSGPYVVVILREAWQRV